MILGLLQSYAGFETNKARYKLELRLKNIRLVDQKLYELAKSMSSSFSASVDLFSGAAIERITYQTNRSFLLKEKSIGIRLPVIEDCDQETKRQLISKLEYFVNKYDLELYSLKNKNYKNSEFENLSLVLVSKKKLVDNLLGINFIEDDIKSVLASDEFKEILSEIHRIKLDCKKNKEQSKEVGCDFCKEVGIDLIKYSRIENSLGIIKIRGNLFTQNSTKDPKIYIKEKRKILKEILDVFKEFGFNVRVVMSPKLRRNDEKNQLVLLNNVLPISCKIEFLDFNQIHSSFLSGVKLDEFKDKLSKLMVS